jgi:cytochrome c553
MVLIGRPVRIKERHSAASGRLALHGLLLSLSAFVMPVAAQLVDPARGAALYQTYCLDCHGPRQAPTNLTVLNARNLSGVLAEGIANPRSGMQFLRDVLSPTDMDSVVAYLGTEPAQLDFGRQALGEPGIARSVTIRSGREPLTGLATTVQGDFSRVGGSCGLQLGPDQSCTVELRFDVAC